jgi:iron(III) transport system permease protein
MEASATVLMQTFSGRKRALRKHLAFWGFTLTLSVLVLVPLGLLIINSFRNVDAGGLHFGLEGLTLVNYANAYSNARTYSMIANSIMFAFGSMMVAFVLGGTLAFLYERTDLRFRGVIPVAVAIPLIMPGVVKGIAWIFLLSPKIGLLNQIWSDLGFSGPLLSAYSLTAMIWVEGISMTPLAFLLLAAVLHRMDPSLEEVSLGSGAPPLKTLIHVTLPLLAPGFAGAMLLLFIRAIDSFEIPILLGFNAGIFVFSTNIYWALRTAYPPAYGLGFSYSMTLIAFSVFGLYLYQRQLQQSERYAVVSGKGYRPRLIPLGRWQYAAWGFVLLFMIFGALLPTFILVWQSFFEFFTPPSWSAFAQMRLNKYGEVLGSQDFLLVVKNTMILALMSSVFVMFLSVLVSWMMHRTDFKGRKFLDFVTFMPYAIPGIAIGVAFMAIFLSFPNPLYNTIWILALAYVVNYLPIGTRFTHAAIVQIHKELEEAAWAAGAGFSRTLRYVWIPLLMPALRNGGFYLFVLSIKVMSIAALLHSPDSLVYSVYMWTVWDNGDLGGAAALSVLMIVFLSALLAISGRVQLGLSNIRE